MLDRVDKPAPEIIPENTYLETQEPGFQKSAALVRGVVVAVLIVAAGAFFLLSKPGAEPVSAAAPATDQVAPQTFQPASPPPVAGPPPAAAPAPAAEVAPPPPARAPAARRTTPEADGVTPPAAITPPIPEVIAPAEPTPEPPAETPASPEPSEPPAN